MGRSKPDYNLRYYCTIIADRNSVRMTELGQPYAVKRARSSSFVIVLPK